MKVWLDNQITDAKDAKIPVLDHGLLYGDGVFEGIRIAYRRIFRCSDHIVRLRLSASAIGMDLPWSDDFLTTVISDTAGSFGKDEAYVRLIVTRGSGALGVDPGSCPEPRLICIVGDISLFDEETRRKGLSLITSSLRRPSFDVLDPRVKSLNYLNSVLAKAEARRASADDALILNQAGRVAEASVANLFIAKAGKIYTPPPNEGALAGMTRQTILESTPVIEQPLTRVDLFGADEVFLSGSGAGLIPVASLDGRIIGTDSGRPVFRRCCELLDAARRTLGESFA